MDFDPDVIYVNGIYLDQLTSGLETSRNNLENEVSTIYKDLDELKTGWDGDSYNTFINIMDDYKEPLNSVATCIAAFQDFLSKDVIPAVNDFQEEVCSALGASGVSTANTSNGVAVENS